MCVKNCENENVWKSFLQANFLLIDSRPKKRDGKNKQHLF